MLAIESNRTRIRTMRRITAIVFLLALATPLSAQQQTQQFVAPTRAASQEELDRIKTKLTELSASIEELRGSDTRRDSIADVEIYAKAAEWIVRHGEFYNEKYAGWTVAGIDRGLVRAEDLKAAKPGWSSATGRLSRGFVSRVDRSVQPYGLVIPSDYGKEPERKWRLDVELHGRGANLNEVSFLNAHDSAQPVPADQDFIQLDIFGRTNNAYRWAGETDVFEAIESVKRRYRIDDRRIVLRGFSMGGAGSWHLGLHHPDKWCSVGPGAGFTDTKKYQKITAPLSPWEDSALHIYDAEDYAINAFNVPIVAYGGEDDPQLAASRGIKETLEKLDVKFTLEPDSLNETTTDIPFLYLVGPKTGHQFHPDSRKRAMEFHATHAAGGTPYFRDRVRFVTYTLKYPGAFGYTILRMNEHYQPATIEASRGADGVVDVRTTNVALLEVSRGVGPQVRLGGDVHDLETAAGGSLPTVLFASRGGNWELMDYVPSLGELRRNYAVKRPGLQGPIDDAFTGPFLCVRGTGEPWSPALAAYANWSLDRFAREWDKYLRGKLPIKNDTDVTEQDIENNNIILFGDPGSNRLLAEILPRLPLEWARESIRLGDATFATQDHVPVLIYPNPKNARRYVVINTGHTFHAKEFQSSNAQLYPRLGDFAVLQLAATSDNGFEEKPVKAGIFNEQWKLP
jgi:dienelactone hydrolase